VSAKRRFRPDSEWARLGWTLVAIAAVVAPVSLGVGWVLAHVSDALWGVR